MLELILKEIIEIKSEITEMKMDICEIKQLQEVHSKQLGAIQEQVAKNTELEFAVSGSKADIKKLQDDVTLIKRVIAN